MFISFTLIACLLSDLGALKITVSSVLKVS